MSGSEAKAIGERVEGWTEIYPRHIGGDKYRVLSTRNDTLTIHKVNIKKISCTCKDDQYNQDRPMVCAHLAAATYVAPQQVTAEDHAVGTLLELARSGQIGVQAAPTETEGLGPEDVMGSDSSPSEEDGGDEETYDMASAADGVDTVRDWLEPAITEIEHVSIEAGHHNSLAGVRIEPDNRAMTDGGYEAFKGVVNSIDATTPHVGFTDSGCQSCGEKDDEFYYFVANENLDEVPG